MLHVVLAHRPSTGLKKISTYGKVEQLIYLLQ